MLRTYVIVTIIMFVVRHLQRKNYPTVKPISSTPTSNSYYGGIIFLLEPPKRSLRLLQTLIYIFVVTPA
jgi:hypothetical protein